MFFPTALFLKRMSVERSCPGCHVRYLGAMESELSGICGRCLLTAFPSPMMEDSEFLSDFDEGGRGS
jgi:hypothetical protein